MKLFIKCLKDSLREHFGKDSLFFERVLTLLIVAPALAVMIGYCKSLFWFADTICTYFNIDDDLIWTLIIVGCFAVSGGIIYILIDTFQLMSREKRKNEKQEMNRGCEKCAKNVTFMEDRTDCVRCASGEIDAFEPICEVKE